MPAHARYTSNTPPPLHTPNIGKMLVGSVAAGAMFTLWNYARHQKSPYLQYGTLAVGGAALSIGQQLVRNAVKAASR